MERGAILSLATTFPLMRELLEQLKAFPEYFIALKGAVAVLAMGLPIYLGLRYFLYRRKLRISIGVTLNFIGTFILFAGLAFLLASPLAKHLPGFAITAYLFMTCLVAAMGVVSLIDVFLIQYYLIQLKQVYVSPPLRAVVKLLVFVVALLPILRFILHFNPLAIVAIPTIATAALALALQDTIKTFIAGVGLGHIIRIGEWIAFNGREGKVISINWARTVMESVDGQRIFIPNTLLQSGVFSNLTAGSPQNLQVMKIGASYETPPWKVKEVLLESIRGISGVMATPSPMASLLEYGDSAMVYGLYYWITDFTRKIQVQDEVASRAWYAFRREGIAIPYPIRTIQLERRRDTDKRRTVKVTEELKRWTLADAFYTEELEDLAKSTRSGLYAPGEIIVREGEPGQSLFTMVGGEVEVLAGANAVATLGPRDIFGEMSLLTGAPRSATVRAKSPVEVLEIDKPAMQHLIAKRPELSDRLAKLVCARQTDLAKARQDAGARATSKAEPELPETVSQRIRQFFGLA